MYAVSMAPACLAHSVLISGGLCGPSADHRSRENTLWSCCGQSCPHSVLQQWLGGGSKWDLYLWGGNCSWGWAAHVRWAAGLELLWAELPSRQPPVMVVAGEQDQCLPGRKSSQGWLLHTSPQLAQNKAEQAGGSHSAYLEIKCDFTASQQAMCHFKESLG